MLPESKLKCSSFLSSFFTLCYVDWHKQLTSVVLYIPFNLKLTEVSHFAEFWGQLLKWVLSSHSTLKVTNSDQLCTITWRFSITNAKSCHWIHSWGQVHQSDHLLLEVHLNVIFTFPFFVPNDYFPKHFPSQCCLYILSPLSYLHVHCFGVF